ncbi:glycoside hydrolase family 30 protein [Siansivirga zeaxanthinifaciens]|uniref:Glucosylceramidase n=1 Tax=Siansivirga zeaxanthinifaciens CC-SAMT-1 TaxID=1454006 RepID=A0A0C5WBQ1_9FLAO|nr:glycoside hydrolase family 30 beta sandwich domain-containing protein [Siansivirga zeaxanthinifaciens]AJR04538.1 glucosylceramidase [Siansivirga zeaxanthinifaciens CC-SAMT-1]
MKKINYKILKTSFFVFILINSFFGCHSCQSNDEGITDIKPPVTSEPVNVDFYLTKADQSVLFKKQETGVSAFNENSNFSINVNSNRTYQEMDGFGYSLTGGSALHLNNMSTSTRGSLLNELFKWDNNNIGVSYLRVSMGSSDLDIETFSYNDLSNGETDLNLDKFSIAKDRINLIPVLKEILAINPNIKIAATPWSAPTWMKTNRSTIGGSLRTDYYDTYANYFVKYIQAMASEGIKISAVIPQNEPLNATNNPSMVMEAAEQANFIKNHLGPAFQSAGITTKIIAYGHNADRPDYPINVLNDAAANPFIDGSAFHLYAGRIDNLSLVHNAHPNKNIYFSEQWVGAFEEFSESLKWHSRELLVGATRNWSKTVLQWNLAADSNQDPHTNGGCTECLGALTIDGNTVKRNVAYYIIAHAAKYVRPGSVRIESNSSNELPNVAFKTPDNRIVVIVINNTSTRKEFNIKVAESPITTSLEAGALGTFVW